MARPEDWDALIERWVAESPAVSPIVFTVGVRTESPNRVRGTTRGAAMARWKKEQTERRSARVEAFVAMARCRQHIGYPRVVTLTRLGAGELQEDNLLRALKHVRDGVADAHGVDDADPRITWVYGQRKCRRGVFGVEVRIERREDDLTNCRASDRTSSTRTT